MERQRLGFVGSGNMAEAIVRAAIEGGVLRTEQIVTFDPSPDRREAMSRLGVGVAESNEAVAAASEQVVLAVKPQAASAPAAEVGAALRSDHVVVSIMAGISTRRIAEMVRAGAGAAAGAGERVRVVRVMPNTPLMVGLGMAGVALGEEAEPGDDELTVSLLSAAGRAVRVEESALDAITAVSGSGPAYLFYLAQAMERAAAELGLGQHARLLVAQTLRGASELLAASEDDAATLRRKVASPGGTTEAALASLDAAAVDEAVVEAIRAAERRSRELGA